MASDGRLLVIRKAAEEAWHAVDSYPAMRRQAKATAGNKKAGCQKPVVDGC